MIDVNKLKGVIYEKGLSQRQVAQAMGISTQTFYSKMKKGIFDSNEIDALIDILDIRDPIPIFFTQFVACYATNRIHEN